MNYNLETVKCPLCGENGYKPYITHARELYNGTDNYFDVVKCVNCQMIFTNPRPTKETIGFFYPDSANYYQPKTRNKDNTIEEKASKTVLANYYGYKFQPPFGKFRAAIFSKLFRSKLATSHIPRFVTTGKLLDIGCSWGQYLARMARYGWDVYGIEINKKAVEHAQHTLGLKNIHNGSFDDYQCPDEFFDVIHMSMVLEHMHEPLQCLQRVNKLLKKGGQLIISVPDISGFEAKIYGKYAYTLQVPQHLNHFTPDTIRAILNKADFTVEKIVHQSAAKDLTESAKYLDNKLLYKILNSSIIKKGLARPFVFLLSKLGKTSRMSICAVK
ncbi:MAG: class I SAM-dependent methyltransferase [Planctomycetaceae bacterium]|nr:class I SAM-dependent methyltransferase [Planctomycetaceae bacterium]